MPTQSMLHIVVAALWLFTACGSDEESARRKRPDRQAPSAADVSGVAKGDAASPRAMDVATAGEVASGRAEELPPTTPADPGAKPLEEKKVERKLYDPTPVESPVGPAAQTNAAAVAAPRQTIPFGPGENPFASLVVPTVKELGSDDPRADTLRLGPEPPPEAGEVVEAFPPAVKELPPPMVEIPDLKVLRNNPVDKVDVVDAVTAAFNQPMVPLAALLELDGAASPLKLEPAVEGRFIWLGTDTVAFKPLSRLPMATRFTATIAAGVKSALGKTLPSTFSWNFETSRPTLVHASPSDEAEEMLPDTTFSLTFNARMEAHKTLSFLELTDEHGKKHDLALAGEPEPDPAEKGRVPEHDESLRISQTVLVKPAALLPLGTRYTLTVSRDLVCQEGPLTMGEDRKINFATYYPLKMTKISCSWDDEDCYPGTPVNIEFNNRLRQQDVSKSITFTPAVEGVTYRVSGRAITAYGEFLPAQKYTVNISFGTQDVHGQRTIDGSQGSVKYRDASPILSLARTGMIVVEAEQSREILLSAMNLDKAHMKLSYIPQSAIVGKSLLPFDYYSWEDEPSAGLQVMVDRDIKPTDKPNRIKRTPLRLDAALEAAEGVYGFVFLDVKARRSRGLFNGWDTFRQTALVQITDLGLTAALAEDEIHAMVTRLGNGEPVEKAWVELYAQPSGARLARVRTDSHGVARLDGPVKFPESQGPYLLMASYGSDRSFLLLRGYVDGGDYQSTYDYSPSPRASSELRGFAFSEKGLYKPTEKVHMTVIARKRKTGPAGDLESLSAAERTFNYTAYDPRWNEIAKGKVKLSPFGTGNFTVKVPKDAPLGHYSVELSGGAGAISAWFQVQEFRTPEYEASAEWLHGGSNVLIRRKLDAIITGKYFFGAPMTGADVEWTLRRQSTAYHPPDNPDFAFTDINSESPSRWAYYDTGEYSSSEYMASGSGKLDSQGRLALPFTLEDGGIERYPVSFSLEAEIYDKNRQSVAARSTIVAHRAERYVGLRLDRKVVLQGETVEVSGVVTRLDGSRYDDAEVAISLMRGLWEEKEEVGAEGEPVYHSIYREEEAGRCTFAAGTAPGKCILTPRTPGTYMVRAQTLDLAGRPANSALRLFVHGEDTDNWTSSSDNRVDIVSDKEEYEAGQTASLLIQSPFKKARGLLMISREGFSHVEPLVVLSGSVKVDLAIEDRWLPSVSISTVLVRGRTEEPGKTTDDRGRPAFAYGSRRLSISRSARTIEVAIKPSVEAMEPGSVFSIGLETKGPDGKPVPANVALMVVDEGVLSLIAYATPNPLTLLYQQVSGQTGVSDIRPLVLPRTKPKVEFESMAEDGVDEKMYEQKAMPPSAPGSKGGGVEYKKSPAKAKRSKMTDRSMNKDAPDDSSGDAGVEFSLRQFFKSTAYFDGSLRTGNDGKLTVDVKMPDNLTQFRIMAVAADRGVKFGSADTQVRTRRPLVVRPALPRFLNLGDRFEAAAVVNNETGFDTTVMVRCRAANATVDEETRAIEVKAGEAQEVRFTAAAGTPGPATFQFAAVSLTEKRFTDAAEVTIPTLIPATSEAFAAYGVVDEAVKQPISPPQNVLPDYGGLDVALSSTALTGLQDAVSYLFDYPYECTEQICSRILPIIALNDVIADFKLGYADSPEKARKLVVDGLKTLYLRQQDDGGFGFWPGSYQSWLYISAYAGMTMQTAQKEGYEIDENRLEQLASFLEYRLSNPYEWESYAYGAQTMACLVLSRMGRAPHEHIDRLYGLAMAGDGKKSELTLYARAWLMEAMHIVHKQDPRVASLHKHFVNAAVDTASAIHFSETRTESLKLMMHSEERTDAIVLSGLLAVRPDDAMVEKVVRGLVRSRVRGSWSTTQANAYALLALADYYKIFETEVPDFEARLWYGEKTIAAHTFKGREMTISKTRVPMQTLLEDVAHELILGKTGPGRLYYRLGLKYAPADLRLAAEDRGFMVERVYLPEGGEDGLRRREDGAWVARAGTYIRVMIRVVAPDRRYYVAVVDPLPAGLEAVNEAFVTSATQRLGEASTEVHHSPDRWWGYWNPWDFEERRDDRIQLFVDRMYGGVYEYTYFARATTIGTFVVPPTRAEEMYEPEIFGRSSSEVFVIEE